MPWYTIEKMDPEDLREELESILARRHPSGLGSFKIYPRVGKGTNTRTTSAMLASKFVHSCDDILEHIGEHPHYHKWNIAETHPEMPEAARFHDDLYGFDDTSRATNTTPGISHPLSCSKGNYQEHCALIFLCQVKSRVGIHFESPCYHYDEIKH